MKRNKKAQIWGSEPEFFGPLHYFRESLIIAYLDASIREGEILDVGLGSGSLSFRLVARGFKVKGIDLSAGFVKYVNQKIKEMGIERQLAVRKDDATRLNFENNSFDGIVCGEVLEHIENDFLAIREMNRVLKKGGICVMTVPANPGLWDFSDEWAGHYRRYQKSELKALLENNGFKVDRIEFWGFPLVRIYHRFIFLPLLKRKLNKTREKHGEFYKKTIFKKFSPWASHIFRIDNLFNRFPWGIGLIARAIKI